MRPYPEESAGPFPSPPETITDDSEECIEIRELSSTSEEDRDRLVEMYEAFDSADRAQGIPPVGRDEIVAWLDLILEEGPDVVADHDGTLVGHATLVPDDQESYELAIFVHQDYRRRGIGSALVRALLGTAATQGIKHVWLTVERWNRPAIGLYEDVGFEPTRRGRFEHEMSIRLDVSTV